MSNDQPDNDRENLPHTPSSAAAAQNPYAPSQPSQLRESQRPPSTPGQNQIETHDYFTDHDGNHTVGRSDQDAHLRHRRGTQPDTDLDNASTVSDENTHGSYSPRLPSPNEERPTSPFPYHQSHQHLLADSVETASDTTNTLFGDIMKRNTTKILAKRHGLRHSGMMYLYYYIPFLNWIRQYRWSHLPGDLTASLTMASFYIPMSLSYAENLAHVPAVSGLYAFAVNPILYAILGSCPQLIVGPEAAGSLLTGGVIRDAIKKGKASDDDDGELVSRIAGTVTGVAGAVLLLGGLARVGFLDNVLSRPFLRGFISAIGIVIFIDQLITCTGLVELAKDAGVNHGSPVDKLMFLCGNIGHSHGLTAAVSFSSFAFIMVSRELKRRLQPRFPKVAYIPDRFIVVVTTTVMSWKLNWKNQGMAVLGRIMDGRTAPFSTHWPFSFGHIKDTETALSTSFVIAMLGFFESSVAARSMGAPPADGIQNISRSPNRELIALGFANVVGGCFMAIPAFGGYGRSKVNASTGGKTPMSNVFLSIFTILSVFLLLPAFYYIPKGVLSAMILVVGWSLIEEAPTDLRFFWQIRGYMELLMIAIVFLATFFYSLEVGIAFGIGFSILRVIKHATRPRIQILGRARSGEDQFENAEADPERFELIEDCLIVKIPEPLTFANTGDLERRLGRLAEYESSETHPALPRVRELHHNKNIIFDIHGVTSLDGAGAQVLSDLLQSYKEKGVRIFFCRVPNPRSKVYRLLVSSGIVDICGGHRHFVGSVKEAIRMSKLESLTQEFRDEPETA